MGIAFGHNLRRHRKASGWSQEALGFEAGLHRTYIGILERGEAVPRAGTVVQLATALGITAHDLLDGIRWTPGDTTDGALTVQASSQADKRRDLRARAEAFRARQSQPTDVVKLVREGREELERRGLPEADEGGG